MNGPALLLTSLMVVTVFAGCFGGSADDGFDYVPGEGYTETGNIVRIRMWVVDILQKELYPGLDANLWAFCAEASDPEDTYSQNAIEYWHEGEKCSVPGPTLRVTQGDRVIVQFENDHFHPHTIHWHGQHVPMSSDGVPGVTQDSVPQGGSFTYDFVAKRAGTLWYHCHVDVQFHVMMGLYGMMIVEPQEKKWEPKDIDKEFFIIMSGTRREHVEYVPPLPGEEYDPHAEHKANGGHDCGVSSGWQDCQNPAVVTKPDVFLVNGLSFPNTIGDPATHMTISPGERVRVRMLNAGETDETWHFHGHDAYVTHKDGNPLPPSARFWAETIAIGPGERYDAVIEGTEAQAGNWVMHTHVEDHVANDQQAPGGMLTMITYPGFEDQLRPFAAELPGGQPFVRARVVPEDVRWEFGQAFTTPTPEVDIDLPELPAEDLCLVEDLTIGFHLYGDAASLAASSLVLTVRDSANQKVEYPLGGPDGAVAGTFAPAFANLTAGTYEASLSGTAVGVQFHASGVTDYFPTEQAAKDAGRPCGAVVGDDGHAHGH